MHSRVNKYIEGDIKSKLHDKFEDKFVNYNSRIKMKRGDSITYQGRRVFFKKAPTIHEGLLYEPTQQFYASKNRLV